MKKIIYIALCIIGGGMLGTSCSEPDELTPRVERLCSVAEVAGGRTPATPRAISAPLKPMTKR